MLSFLTGVASPTLAFIVMLIVGLELRPADFTRVARYPRTVIIATVGQAVLLPLLAVFLVRLIALPRELAVPMLFLAFSPGGALSNYYTSLAGRNVALSVTLTAVSTILSLVSIPIAAVVLLDFIGVGGASLSLPKAMIMLQLFLFVVFPIALGMGVGNLLGDRLGRWRPALKIGALLLVVLLLATSLWTVRGELAASLSEIVLMATLFTCGAMLVGYLISRLTPAPDRDVIVIECAVRNIPVAVLLGSSVDNSATYVCFVAVYFLVEVALMVPYAVSRRMKSVRE